MSSVISHHPVDEVRMTANRELDPSRKSALGQFMTPSPIARFMAGMFENWGSSNIRLLDAGAGVGSLSAAFLDEWLTNAPKHANAAALAYELDPTMQRHLALTLSVYERVCSERGHSLRTEIMARDFIELGTEHILFGTGARFTHAILNPPYKKINGDSAHRKLLRQVGLETVNLYSAFLAVAIALMEKNGELVAIIPRSFCNGTYYKPFRDWMEKHASITHLHLFESRHKAFKDDEVLQENVIIRWVREAPPGPVTVSWCDDITFSGLQSKTHPHSAIIHAGDPERFIRIPLHHDDSTGGKSPLFSESLDQLGLEISTGPVVDFRLQEYLRAQPDASTVPLLYPQHFKTGGLRYPAEGKKPNAISMEAKTEKWLYPSGWYVITKRFSSKEEPRRVVAHVIDPEKLPGKKIGFENHVNVFHKNKVGIDPNIARGLSVFLNSTLVDKHFRVFSGHTQVNATDLRQMKYPSREKLLEFGEWAKGRTTPLDQTTIDDYIERQS